MGIVLRFCYSLFAPQSDERAKKKNVADKSLVSHSTLKAKMRSLVLVSIFFAISSASVFNQNDKYCSTHPNDETCQAIYLTSVCEPRNSTGGLDYNAPCNIWSALMFECTYGNETLDLNETNAYTSFLDLGKPQSNSSQRLCTCESQFWDSYQGCKACYEAHGSDNSQASNQVSSISSAYCAATATPTLGLIDFWVSWLEKPAKASILSSHSTRTKSSAFSDPIGNKTAVSLYYTPAVTGTAALDIAGLTDGATRSTTNILNGQIVPTTSVTTTRAGTRKVKPTTNGKGPAAAGSSSSSSTSGSGARHTDAAIAGVIGLVGLVAML